MKNNNIIKACKCNNFGFSLVEVIVSMTILVIVAGILLTGVMTAGTISGKSVDLTNAGYTQAAELEAAADSVTGSGNETVQLIIDSENIQVTGDYISSLDDNTGVSFTMFMAKAASGSPDDEAENTSTQAFIGGDSDYPIVVNGTIPEYVIAHTDGGGASLPDGSIYYDSGGYVTNTGEVLTSGYYVVRNGVYVGKNWSEDKLYKMLVGIQKIKRDVPQTVTYKLSAVDEDPVYVTVPVWQAAPYGQKININMDPENLPEPSLYTEAGDLKRIGDDFYVFFPQSSRWEHDFEDGNNWIKIDVDVLGL